MLTRVSIVLLSSVCWLALSACTTSRVPSPSPKDSYREAGIGANFPNSEAFYPPRAAMWGREGLVTVHYCSDENGQLTAPPTVHTSSGHADLDEAALQLAQAGSGHYRPAYQNGNAVPGCATFRVLFQQRVEPRFPTLSRRRTQLLLEYQSRAESFEARLRDMQLDSLDLTPLVEGDKARAAKIHHIIDSAGPLLDSGVALFSELIARMDDLGRASDVDEEERAQFSRYWQKQRVILVWTREGLLSSRSYLASVGEMADYVDKLRPAAHDRAVLTAAQQADLNAFGARLRAEFDRDNGFNEGVTKLHATPEAERELLNGTFQPFELVSIDNLQYSPGSLPDVILPGRTNGDQVAPDCSYPTAASAQYEEGIAVVDLTIDSTGHVTAAKVHRASGYDELDAAAIKCSRQTRYSAATRSGRPVSSVLRVASSYRIPWEQLTPTCPKKSDDAGTLGCNCYDESGKVKDPADAPDLFHPPGHPGCMAVRRR